MTTTIERPPAPPAPREAPARPREPKKPPPRPAPPATDTDARKETPSASDGRVQVADLFCGAGGSSTGAQKAIESLGGTMALRAVNHWPTAIATHQLNHPQAEHYIYDVEHADPESIVPDRYLDLLMASPECRFYSRARGGRPTHDQGRMTPWAIFNWLTKLKVRTVLIENVPEFTDWCELGDDDRPLKSKKGLYFQSWFKNFENLGYHAEYRCLNAADFGDATTRTRFFLIARNDGLPIVWPEATHSKHGEETLLGRLPKWRGAEEIIDWDNPGRSLLDDPKYRRHPLSEKTRRRIAKGIERDDSPLSPYYIPLLDLPEHQPGDKESSPGEKQAVHTDQHYQPPHFIVNRHGDNGSLRIHPVSEPFPTSTTRGAGYLLTTAAVPAADLGIIVPGAHLPHPCQASAFTMANRNENAPRRPSQPLHPITTSPGGGGLCLFRTEAYPLPVSPFILGQHSCSAPRDLSQPLPTIATDGAIAFIRPSLTLFYGQSVSQDLDRPLSTVLGCRKHALVEPILVQYFGTGTCSLLSSPVPTLTTHDRYALAAPSLIQVNHGLSRRDPADGRCQGLDLPLGTITTKRNTALVSPGVTYGRPALMDLAHGNGRQGHAGNDRRILDLLRPLPTVLTTAAFALATPAFTPAAPPSPFLVQRAQTGGNGAYVRPVSSPFPTITTHNDLGLALPFLVPNFGEHPNQDPRTHSIFSPLPTVTAKGACNLVIPASRRQPLPEGIDPRRLVYINGDPHILDIRFRMLQNNELARAMGFSDDEIEYEFTGNTTEITKQIGNAVPVNLASALVKAILSPQLQGTDGAHPAKGAKTP